MKEFVVCFTLENDIKREKIIKAAYVKKEEVVNEILEKIGHSKYYIAKGEKGEYRINTSLIRFVSVLHEKEVV
ncbi:hypothetical protein V7266_07520 [Neobacillus drentensis]|uniref:hypothetical protein n=1 Tax=Neobacillus drentensis TaxID=220684 RepID=UPI002FFEFA18